TTSAPCSANASAMPRPNPRLAPVTTQVFPANENMLSPSSSKRSECLARCARAGLYLTTDSGLDPAIDRGPGWNENLAQCECQRHRLTVSVRNPRPPLSVSQAFGKLVLPPCGRKAC